MCSFTHVKPYTPATRRTSLNMSRIPVPAPPTMEQNPHIQASVLFHPIDLDEYAQWRDPHENYGWTPLPTAFEYADFLAWRDAEKTRKPVPLIDAEAEAHLNTGGQIAITCGHAVHAGHPTLGENGASEGQEVERCPRCVVDAYVQLLGALRGRWDEAGGPWKEQRVVPTEQVRKAYTRTKTEFANAVQELEDIAVAEVEWEAAHPAYDVQIVGKYAAVGALQDYVERARFGFPAEFLDESVLPKKVKPRRRNLRVRFSGDTPQDTRHRPYELFSRNCIAYEPETHACVDEDGWEDHGLAHDWEFNVKQCRVLFCDKPPERPDVTYRELTAEDHKERMLKHVQTWLAMMDPTWVVGWTDVLRTTTDMFFVWKRDVRKGGPDEFDCWERQASFVGTNLEAHARLVGDIDEDDEAGNVGIKEQDEEGQGMVGIEASLEEDDFWDPEDDDMVVSDCEDEKTEAGGENAVTPQSPREQEDGMVDEGLEDDHEMEE
ncbi:hypothetical protein P153DRAFT_332635 [Dothidotthia symphoricarpi CBS 119687]|uniref:Uncharacterized protein n=1 Tax=Dothidotthia symphoricarpi CBS 119687 TaxID=1392245 RepID=A0A6A6APA9_9PLEO|nr:uncharacterized protein P153DRAFT_332635 [Dothidotthia symphoricarpi CBS 119687]KAF2133630.1 hypothetical protein P153DRAFT_332635 [Dothidotthia symphoricarpi CBS 119687]